MGDTAGGAPGAGLDSHDESDRSERQAGGKRERRPGHDMKAHRQSDHGDECRQAGNDQRPKRARLDDGAVVLGRGSEDVFNRHTRAWPRPA